jgi:hypothetical protein
LYYSLIMITQSYGGNMRKESRFRQVIASNRRTGCKMSVNDFLPE